MSDFINLISEYGIVPVSFVALGWWIYYTHSSHRSERKEWRSEHREERDNWFKTTSDQQRESKEVMKQLTTVIQQVTRK